MAVASQWTPVARKANGPTEDFSKHRRVARHDGGPGQGLEGGQAEPFLGGDQAEDRGLGTSVGRSSSSGVPSTCGRTPSCAARRSSSTRGSRDRRGSRRGSRLHRRPGAGQAGSAATARTPRADRCWPCVARSRPGLGRHDPPGRAPSAPARRRSRSGTGPSPRGPRSLPQRRRRSVCSARLPPVRDRPRAREW